MTYSFLFVFSFAFLIYFIVDQNNEYELMILDKKHAHELALSNVKCMPHSSFVREGDQ